jgi:UDP-N-acetylglucosamine 2-epimerase (non-hydrolysing)
MKKEVLVVFGTRPEAIKLAPVIKELKKNTTFFNTTVCVTGQHREMLDQVLSFFKITPDIDLNLMTHNQTLSSLTSKIILEIDAIFQQKKYDTVIIQGDTTTVYATAVCAFYNKVKIAHVEAGLRSFDFEHPFPEEFNRRGISSFVNYNFTPSIGATNNLINEQIDKNKIFHVGNTVIDALNECLTLFNKEEIALNPIFSKIDFQKKFILVTGHRRENFGNPLQEICSAFIEIIEKHQVQIVYPVHLNPNVKDTVNELLGNIENIILIPPLAYQEMIWLMNQSYFIITDSGGIQEEAPALGKPVLVTREVTERKEVVDSGNAIIVGNNKEKIIKYSDALLTDELMYEKMSKANNPYGNGTAALQIIEILKK